MEMKTGWRTAVTMVLDSMIAMKIILKMQESFVLQVMQESMNLELHLFTLFND